MATNKQLHRMCKIQHCQPHKAVSKQMEIKLKQYKLNQLMEMKDKHTVINILHDFSPIIKRNN